MYSKKKECANYSFNYYNVEKQIISKIFNCLFIDKAAYFKIDFKIVEKYDFIWRVIHSGGELDFELIKRLKDLPSTIIDFIRENNLEISQGITDGKARNKVFPDAKRLVGKNLSSHFTKYFIDFDKLVSFASDIFERPHDFNQYYSTNKVIIKRSISQRTCAAAYIQKEIVFTDDFYCIYSNELDDIPLLFLTGLINSKLYNYFQFHCSPSYGKGFQSEVKKFSIEEFPLPDLTAEAIFGVAKLVSEMQALQSVYIHQELESALPMDGVKHTQALYEKGLIQSLQNKIDEEINRLFEISDNEIVVIEHTENYVLNSAKNEIFTTKKYEDRIKQHFLTLFDDEYDVVIDSESKFLFSTVLVSLLPKGKSLKDTEIKALQKTILNFYNLYSFHELNDKVAINKTLMGFFEDGFFVVKINDNKYWDEYSAIKDINKFTTVMFEGGYN